MDWVKFLASAAVAVFSSLQMPKADQNAEMPKDGQNTEIFSADVWVVFAIVSAVIGYIAKAYFAFQQNMAVYQNLITQSMYDISSSAESSAPVHMETDVEEGNLVQLEERDSLRTDDLEHQNKPSSDVASVNIESYLPDCVSNVARLLETILQNADTCRLFVEKKGIDSILQLFTLPSLPLSASIGQSVSVAFKNFSPQHSASLARSECSFLREHLKTTNDLLVSLGGSQLATVLRCLSSLEGLLSLSNFLLKGTTSFVSELSTADSYVLKDLGRAYREIVWKISLSNDSVVDAKKNSDQEAESTEAATC